MNLTELKNKIKKRKIKRILQKSYENNYTFYAGKTNKIITNQKDAKLLVEIIKEEGYDAYKPKLIIIARRAFPNLISIDDVENIICKYGKPYDAYECALSIPGVNISKMEDIILNAYRTNWSWLHEYRVSFAQYIPGANIQKLQKSIIDEGNAEVLVEFMQRVENADKVEISYFLLENKKFELFNKVKNMLNENDVIEIVDQVADCGDAEICDWVLNNVEMQEYYKYVLEFAKSVYANQSADNNQVKCDL